MRTTLIRVLTLLAFGLGVWLPVLPAGTAQDASSGSGSEIKRRLDYWKNSPDADILFQGIPADAAATTPKTGPQAVALCIGINTVDPRHYSADPRQPVEIAPLLWGAVDDARMVARGFRRSGFDVTLLTDERATTGAVTQFLTAQAAVRAAGDLVVVYFAGYGARLTDRWGRQRHALCLYDRMLFEEELFRALAQFKAPGPEIVLVLDCGTGTAAPKDVFDVTQAVINAKPEQLSGRLAWALARFPNYVNTLREYKNSGQLHRTRGGIRHCMG